MSEVNCQFAGCDISSRLDPNVRKFHFPKDAEVVRKWVDNSGNATLPNDALRPKVSQDRHLHQQDLLQRNLPEEDTLKKWDDVELKVQKVTKTYSRTKSLPRSSCNSTENKENSVISEDLAKLVAEPGRIPTIHLKPLQNFQRNDSETPSSGYTNQRSTKNDISGNCTSKVSSKDNAENQRIEETAYTVVLCEVDNSSRKEQERVCRTCLRMFSIDNTVVIYKGPDNTPQNGFITLREKLDDIGPYIDFNLTERPVVVCRSCENLIHRSYDFKQLCKSSETKLRHATKVTKRPVLDLLQVVNDLHSLSKVDENGLLTPAAMQQNAITISDEIIEDVVNDQLIESDEITDEIVTDKTPAVLNDEITELTSKPLRTINWVDFNDEINLSDVDDGWQWDTIRCDPLEKPNPNKKRPWLEDHDYAAGCEKIPKPLHKLKIWRKKRRNWQGRELNVLSEEFGDYLRYRKGKGPEFYILRKLKTLKKPIQGESPYLCEFCGRVFQTLNNHQSHIMINHGKAEKRICPVCGELILDRYFSQHTLKHSMQRESSVFVCHKCGKCFSRRPNLITHLKIHEFREKKIQCPMCDKMYHTRHQMRLHQRRHGEKQVKCEYCSMSFYFVRELRRHLWRKHEMRAALQCRICDKVLKYEKCFEEHMNAHVKNNKYKCELCSESFRKKGTLETHVNKIHLKIDFTCTYCKRKFYTQFNLNRHLEYIHGKTLFSNFRCYKCDKGYVREEPYKQHLMTAHGISAKEVEKHVSIGNEKITKYIQMGSKEKEESYHDIDKENCLAVEEGRYHSIEQERRRPRKKEYYYGVEESSHAMEEGSHSMEEGSHAMEGGSQTMEDDCHAMDEGSHAIGGGSHAMEGGSRAMKEGSRAMEEDSHAMEEEGCGALDDESYYALEEESSQSVEGYYAMEEESFHAMKKESCHAINEGSYYAINGVNYFAIHEKSCQPIEEDYFVIEEETC